MQDMRLVKEEFETLVEKWGQEKLGRSIKDSEQILLNNPRAMLCDLQGFYLANRVQARFCWIDYCKAAQVWSIVFY